MTSQPKPIWLEELEKQSWQAELIASGLAIYGSLSLGPFIDKVVTYLSTMLPDRVLDVLVFVFIYIYLAHAIMVVSFITHLVLRIVWAGLIGLSSAYPDGINLENKTYPKHFLEKAKSEFPSLADYSLHLDRICSRVFSNLCFLIFTFLGFSFWILILIGIGELIFHLFQIDVTFYLIAIFGIALSLFSLVFSLFTVGPKKESDFSKKFSYPVTQWFSKGMLLFFYKPANYILWIQRTNQSTKQFMLGFLLFVPITIILGMKISDVIGQLEKKEYFQMNASVYDASSRNYLDVNGDTRIGRPIIQSKIIKDDYLELFIPEVRREKNSRVKICGSFDGERNARELKNRIERSSYEENCATQYYKISINDGDPLNLKFTYQRHSLNGERGYLTYIPLDSLPNGSQLLNIKTGYQNEENEYAHRVIPFFKS